MNRLRLASLSSLSSLQWALLGSVLVHGLLLTLRFAAPETFNQLVQDTSLAVVLVNSRADEAPSKAQAIAQHNLAGGGEADAGRATTPLPPSALNLAGDAPLDAQEAAIAQMQDEQRQLLALVRQQLALLPPPDPSRPAATPEARATETQRRQMLRMLAEIDKRIQDENARPRKRYISPATREAAYAVYYDQMRQAIEDRGTRDFPTFDGRKLYGELTMDITIDAAGRVRGARVVRSSGQSQLDRRAVAIVQAAGPYGAFTAQMRRQTDQIVVTSRFRFTREEGLSTEMLEQKPLP
ncbi:MAG: TonB family protein [Proteobacteria bacterium]|nr:TonB family protein [Pseudomonadota bacterium]